MVNIILKLIIKKIKITDELKIKKPHDVPDDIGNVLSITYS